MPGELGGAGVRMNAEFRWGWQYVTLGGGWLSGRLVSDAVLVMVI